MLSTIQILLLVVVASSANRTPHCGGIYTAARGILQTPGFPYDLPVPINCEWVIDAQNLATTATVNTSIVVYFTQLFIYEGLTFTEYQIYDNTYQVDGRIIYSVNETNIVQVRWVQSFQNFLVITLKLDSIDSVHLRVLDRFLDVYGFNMTYEITTNGSVRTDACSMMDCGFTGNCYDHYTKFNCACFDGYTGASCSSGSKSLCNVDDNSMCKNGGTCIHVGTTAVKCRCQQGFTGNTCQIPLHTQDVCNNCVSTCPYDGSLHNACKCSNPGSNSFHDRTGYICTMHLGNLPNLNGDALKIFIQNQIYRTMKMNYSKIDKVNVEDIQFYQSGVYTTFHLFVLRKDERSIRLILSRWANRGYITNLTVTDKEFTFGPLLDLQSISVNHQGVIHQHDEFILSCVARGSTTMTFRWFKDGVFVNATEMINYKWTRLIRDPHLEDQYTALLGVERADILDGGVFTCQIENFGLQQCLSRNVIVKGPPVIKVEPMSQTVKKGDNFTINCISIGTPIQKFTYSWTKNKELIPIRSDNEKYEILYPGGSILQVFNIERSVTYSCLVQDGIISSEVKINIYVIDRDLIGTCPYQTDLGVEWTKTAPDTVTLKMCPKDYIFPGSIRRSCTLKDGINPVWLLPDYSDCTSKELDKIWNKFKLLKLGYEATTIIRTLKSCWRYLETRSNNGLYPGEGAGILHFLEDVISYCRSRGRSNTYNTTIAIFDVIDKILTNRNSLIQQEQVSLLQEVVNQQIEAAALEVRDHQFLNISKSTIGLLIQQDFMVRFDHLKLSTRWRPCRLNLDQSVKRPISIVIYRNLINFLPVRSVLRLGDGNEMEYEIISEVIRVSLRRLERNLSRPVHLEWYQDRTNSTQNDGWYMRCAIADSVQFAFSWNTTICSTQIINNSFVKCTCPEIGTFALLLTRTNHVQVMLKHMNRVEVRSRRYIVLAGCALCFLAALLCSFVLFFHWILKQSCIDFLKFQCSISIAGVMLVFILMTIEDPFEEMFMPILTLIEIFFLTGLSAHISILLIIYTELVELPNSRTSKQTITFVNIGVPVITVFSNHLVHRTMNIELKSWWLIAGTLVFHVFLIVVTILVVLFVFLYIIVYSKLRKLTVVHDQDGKTSKRRVVLLKKSACVFSSLVLVAFSSILYVNFFDVIWWQYEFGIIIILQGLILVVCYIIKSKSKFNLLHGKLKSKPGCSLFGTESVGSSLHFSTKKDTEGETVQQRKFPQENECYQMSNLRMGLSVCVPNTFVNEDVIYCDRSSNNAIKSYNRSPQIYRKNTTSFKCDSGQKDRQQSPINVTFPTTTRCHSPDIISTSNCTELDLVASHARSVVIEPISQILTTENIKVEQTEAKWSQPEDIEETTAVTTSTISLPANEKHNLDKVLDRISHDLDYLLNRNDKISNASSDKEKEKKEKEDEEKDEGDAGEVTIKTLHANY